MPNTQYPSEYKSNLTLVMNDKYNKIKVYVNLIESIYCELLNSTTSNLKTRGMTHVLLSKVR